MSSATRVVAIATQSKLPVATVHPEQTQAEFRKAQGRAAKQHAIATRRAYTKDWDVFVAWCAARGAVPLPALPTTVATFISTQADKGLRASSLSRRLAAIAYVHKVAGHTSPTATEDVRATMRGTVRELAEEGRTEKRQKAPATSDVLISMVEHAPATLIGLRDRALLLLGFAGAFRRSEISALNIQDLEEVADGYRVHVRRSKTDQEGAGQVVAVVRGAKACPVTAVLAWLDAAGIADGPVFRPIDKVGRVSTRALTPHTIGKIVKRYAGFAGYNAAEFGGHSLRAGFATSAVLRGANLFKVMDVTRHKSTDTLRGYVRRAEEFRDHAGAGLL